MSDYCESMMWTGTKNLVYYTTLAPTYVGGAVSDVLAYAVTRATWLGSNFSHLFAHTDDVTGEHSGLLYNKAGRFALSALTGAAVARQGYVLWSKNTRLWSYLARTNATNNNYTIASRSAWLRSAAGVALMATGASMILGHLYHEGNLNIPAPQPRRDSGELVTKLGICQRDLAEANRLLINKD